MSANTRSQPSFKHPSIACCLFRHISDLKNRSKNKTLYCHNKMKLTESLIHYFNGRTCESYEEVEESLTRQLDHWHILNKCANHKRDFMASRLNNKCEKAIELVGKRLLRKQAKAMKKLLDKDGATVDDLYRRLKHLQSTFESIQFSKRRAELPTDDLVMSDNHDNRNKQDEEENTKSPRRKMPDRRCKKMKLY